MTKAPIRVWREPIGGDQVAAVAFIEFVFRGGYHAASCFLILNHRDWEWHTKAQSRLRQLLAEHHGGRVPYVRRVRDIEGAPKVKAHDIDPDIDG